MQEAYFKCPDILAGGLNFLPIGNSIIQHKLRFRHIFIKWYETNFQLGKSNIQKQNGFL